MKRLVLVPCLILAACGEGAPDDANVSVQVPPAATPVPAPGPEPSATPEPEPEATSNEAETAAGATVGPIASIPIEWRGTWAGRDGCARSSTMRVRVAADRLTFYESEGEASEIERRAPREIALRLAMSGEGEEWTRRATLTLSEDGERLTRKEAGSSAVSYTRCPS